MKTILFSLLLTLSIFRVSAQQISTAEMQVTGLTCSMCSKATETSLKTLDFISSIEPDLNKNLFALEFKKGSQVNIDQLKIKVQDAGFSVGSLSADFDFVNLKVDENGQAEANGVVYRFTNVKSKTLNGVVKATIIDKNFVPSSAFKKNSSSVKSSAYATGSGIVNGKKTRIYHLTV